MDFPIYLSFSLIAQTKGPSIYCTSMYMPYGLTRCVR